MSHQIMSLPFHGAPYPGESGGGFLLRLAAINGIQICEFYRLTKCWRNQQPSQSSLPLLARLCGCMTTDLEPIFVRAQYGEGCAQRYAFHGHRITRQYLIAPNHPKVCIACLEERGYAHSLWDLSLYVACPFHRCLLVDACEKCGERLTLFRPNLLTCRCGSRLERQKVAEEVPVSVNAISSLLCSGFGAPCSKVSAWPSNFDLVMRFLQELSLDGISRLTWILGVSASSSSDLARTRRRCSIVDAISIIEQGICTLMTIMREVGGAKHVTHDAKRERVLYGALRRMMEDGATLQDRHCARTCIDALFPRLTDSARRALDDGGAQMKFEWGKVQ